MVDDFDYLSARTRGMRGELLTDEDFRDLLACRRLEDLLSRLRATAYGPVLQSALARRKGVEGAEEGLRDSMKAAFGRLVHASSGKARNLVLLVIGRWETRCLKAVLRGVHRHASPREILAGCVPAGILDEGAIRELARQENVGEVIGQLRLWGYPPAAALGRAWRHGTTGGDLQHLEKVLDQSFLDGALTLLEGDGPGGELFREFLQLEADLTNVLNALRLVQAGSTPSPEPGRSFFLTGGRRVSRDRWRKIAAREDVPSAIQALGAGSLGDLFRSVLPEYRETLRLSTFEKACRRRLYRQARRAARSDPLGIGVILGTLWQKVFEVEDLRLLCRAAHIGLPVEELQQELNHGST